LSDLNKGEGGKKGQPPLPPILPRWRGMPPNWNFYFPWYLIMPPMTVAIGNLDGCKKFLNY
jgi:hypothetical protein